MTDPQIISAVLKSCGWKRPKGKTFWRKKNDQWITGLRAQQILTSLDDCHEVFEKDAPDEYRLILFDSIVKWHGNYMPPPYEVLKATPRQRCLAWLRFKGVESK